MTDIQCPAPNCTTTWLSSIATEVLLKLIDLHEKTTHPTTPSPITAHSTSAKAKKVKRPTISAAGTSEEWAYFEQCWVDYKATTHLAGNDIIFQLLECCDDSLRKDLTRSYGALTSSDEATILQNIRTLAVRQENHLVARVQLHQMRQVCDEPVRAFSARLKGQSSFCSYNADCQCGLKVDYSEHMIRDALIRGIEDNEIRNNILGMFKQDMSLDETLHFIEAKESFFHNSNWNRKAFTPSNSSPQHNITLLFNTLGSIHSDRNGDKNFDESNECNKELKERSDDVSKTQLETSDGDESCGESNDYHINQMESGPGNGKAQIKMGQSDESIQDNNALQPVVVLHKDKPKSTKTPSKADNQKRSSKAKVPRSRSQRHRCTHCEETFSEKRKWKRHMLTHNPLQCSICQKTFKQTRGLASHIRTHSTDNLLKCMLCENTYKLAYHLENHMKLHNNTDKNGPITNPLECSVCHKIFSTNFNLNYHMMIHSGEKSHSCEFCGKTFRRRGLLVIHIRSHTGEQPYECSVCGKKFGQQRSFREHSRIHSGEKPFSCRVCLKHFRVSSTLRNHMKIHNGIKKHECILCGKSFTQKKSLSLHVAVKHTGNKPHKCSQCEKAFLCKSRLVNHMKTHSGEKSYKCEECGKAFYTAGDLHGHMNSHSGEKPYKCNTCGKAFNRVNTLNRHMRCHTGEKPYSCEVCGKKFALSGSLKTHLRTHSAERPIKCTKCPKGFKAHSSLRAHMRTHEGKKEECTLCGKLFSKRESLQNHLRSIHTTGENTQLSSGQKEPDSDVGVGEVKTCLTDFTSFVYTS